MARNRLAEAYQEQASRLTTEELLERRNNEQFKREMELEALEKKIGMVDGSLINQPKKQTIITGSTAYSAFDGPTISEEYYDQFEKDLD